jgi:hypothetical protein
MAGSDDQIREDVERALHLLVGTAIALPMAAVRGVQRCIGRRAADVRRRVTEPAALVRSLFELVGSSRPAGSATGAATIRAGEDETPRPAHPHAADELPIEEYQSLAASQVVARLPALTADELDRIRRFEAAHRGRRTVLGRIDQLLVPT